MSFDKNNFSDFDLTKVVIATGINAKTLETQRPYEDFSETRFHHIFLIDLYMPDGCGGPKFYRLK